MWHSDVNRRVYNEIDAREFSDGSMDYIPESCLTTPVNLRYSGTQDFSAYVMSGKSVFLMMLALKASVEAV